MSLINDALNKAQRDRAQTYGSTLYRSPGTRPHLHRSRSSGPNPLLWAGIAAVAILLVAGAVYFRPWLPTDAREGATQIAASPSLPISAPAISPITSGTDASPFTPPPDAPPPPDASTAQYELTGMSAMGSTTLLSIVRRSDKRSLWVPVGKTVGEVTAVSYDAASDRAVIRVHGAEQTIALRDVGAPANPTAE